MASMAVMGNLMSTMLGAYGSSLTGSDGKRISSRFDAHDTHELQETYNKIYNDSKATPWFLEVRNDETKAYAIALKENARFLEDSIASIAESKKRMNAGTGMDSRIAYCSDPGVARVSYVGGDEAASELSLEVKTLACTQENHGTYVTDGKMNVPSGTYSFVIGTGGTSYEFQLAIEPDDMFNDVQHRIERLINKSEIGVRASVDRKDGQSALSLVSRRSGVDDNRGLSFTVYDTSAEGLPSVVDMFGMDQITRPPSDALYSIDGQQMRSSVNTVTSKGFELELTGTTQRAVTVGRKTDMESLAENVSKLATAYNSFLDDARTLASYQSRSGRLVGEMSRIAGQHMRSLSEMGIDLMSDGSIAVDGATLAVSALTDSLDISSLAGFATDIARKAASVSIDPMQYVAQTMVAYKNPQKCFPNPYITSAYSGMIFDGYC